MKRISIGSWAYNTGPCRDRPVPFDEVLARLAELGFAGVELGGFNGYPNPGNHPTRDDRDVLLARMRSHGLEFSGFAPDLGDEHLLDAREPDGYIAAFKTNVQFAVDLGIRGVRIDCVQPPAIHRQVEYGDLLKRLTVTWDYCINHAADQGVEVFWEFEPGCAFNKPSDVQRVLDHLPHDNFGVLYDTCHGETVTVTGAGQVGKREVLKGGQLEMIGRLSGRIGHIHLMDGDGTCVKDADGNDKTSARKPFGEGHVDFDALVPALAKEDLDHDWWTIDLCFLPDAWDATARCKSFIDDLGERYG